MLGKPYDWATAQMPINVCDYFFRSFLHDVVPQCLRRSTGVIGMKSLGGGNILAAGSVTATECIQFSLSQPISSLVVGLLNNRDLTQALDAARDFVPLTGAQQASILEKVKLPAGDGRHELFKTSQRFDGPYHRKQHGFTVR